MNSQDKGVHCGHRVRMRSKFSEHGARIFDTYELVEMLLYHAIPMRDTNPVAKGLLSGFGSLAGLLSAKREGLLQMPGVGARAAELIELVGKTDAIGMMTKDMRPLTTFNDYSRAGRFLVSYFESVPNDKVAVMLLDDTMRLLGMASVDTPRFGSGATRAKPFVDAALRYGATVAIVGYTNRNSLAIPFEADYITSKMLENELAGIGVSLAESFLISRGGFYPVGPRKRFRSDATPELESFFKTRDLARRYEESDSTLPASDLELELGDKPESDPLLDMLTEHLSELLSFAMKKEPERAAMLLIDRYGSLDAILSQKPENLVATVGEAGAHLLKLTAAIISRAKTDGFAFGKRHTDPEIAEYLMALTYAFSVETVYMLSIDEKGRVKRCDYLGDGTANSSEIYQRRVAEYAIKNGAQSIIIAHNHPTGSASPSNEDIMATRALYATCRAAGVRLYRHVILAQRSYCVLEPDDYGEIIKVLGRCAEEG